MEVNEFQTPITDEFLSSLPKEIEEQFLDIVNNVPFVKSLISPERKRAKDLPRDDKGRIIVDITKPHILEDMDYFRPSALHYKKYGRYTNLRPNGNPNSEYKKWAKEEIRRCWEGYVRESDGEWVTGYMYFYLNYSIIMLSKIVEGSTRQADRVEDFPEVWEGIYLRFHYLEQARRGGLYNNFEGGNHGAELAKRGCSKSFSIASIMAKNFILGENSVAHRRVTSVLTAYLKEYLSGKDGTLDKFVSMIDFLSENTSFPRKRLKKSKQDMLWRLGYEDVETGAEKGLLNTVMGLSVKDDEKKIRGKRGYIFFEEFGAFPKVKEVFTNVRFGVEEGNYTFGIIYLVGTSGDDANDFEGAQELLYHPKGYNIYCTPNVYDKVNQGKSDFAFFFPAYVNRKGCYNKDGVSDVVKALVEILQARYKVKYNSSESNTLIKVIADMPITPAEAMIKTGYNMFPVTDLSERLEQIETDHKILDDVYVADLVINKSGEIEYKPSSKNPIREFPTKNNKVEGAIELFQLPEIDKNTKKPFSNRYIAGADPYDNDEANTMSLGSIFILDLWTDRIVAEYTGRPAFADDYFEICRKLCLFYNAVLNYEAHPYDQLVRLPNGKTIKWKDVKIGDYLFAPNGNKVKVIDIPVDGIDDIYKITLSDGRVVEASSNHIWEVFQINDSKKKKYVTTRQMFDKGVKNSFGQSNFFIPESGSVEYDHTDVPIDPYTLGLLLAEGAFTKFKKNKTENFKRRFIQFSSSKEDAEFYKTVIPYEFKYIGNKGYSWHMYIDDIDLKLKELGLLHTSSHTKFIPKQYLFNDYKTRLELLKGLMDGDGCAIMSAGSVYISVSKRLVDDILILCRSLGLKAKKVKSTYGYRISIASTIPIFKLPRKINKQHIYKPNTKGSKASAILYKTAIKNIEYVGKKRCKCVTVDNPNGLYLIGDYVVTHNCNKKGLFSYFSQHSCTYLLTDVLEFLKEKNLAKGGGYGNTAKGTTATAPVNAYAKNLLRKWLLDPVTITEEIDGEQTEKQVSRLYTVKNKALIKELIGYNTEGNFDRISAMGMLMLLREDKMILCQGNISNSISRTKATDPSNDKFFTNNYDKHLRRLK